MKKFIIPAFFFLLVAATFLSCNQFGPVDASHPYIEAFTTGDISAQAPIIVKFSDEVKFKENFEVGQVLDSKLLKTKPSIKGKTIWKGDNMIEFQPEYTLKNDQSFIAKLNIDKIAVIEDVPKTFTFDFHTIKLGFSYSVGNITCYNAEDENLYFLTGNIYTSDFVKDEDAVKILSFSSGSYHISWTHDKVGRTHTFCIDSIKSQREEYSIKLLFNGKSIGDDKRESFEVRVPKIDVFEYMGTTIEYAPEFVVTAVFSSPIDEKQRLKDKISISGLSLRFVVENNKIKIYPTTRPTGSYMLKIDKKILSKKGKTLPEDISEEVVFDEIKPTVKFLGNGVILPSDNKMTIPFMAINYQEVEVRVTRIFESNVLQFLQENNLPEVSNYQLYRVGKQVASTTLILGNNTVKLKNWGTYSLDLSTIINVQPGALYRVELTGKNPLVEVTNDDEDDDYYYDYYDDYYTRNRERIRNILASDLGITVKMDANNNLMAFVTNLVTAQTESNVTVQVYDFTNQLMCEGKTDNQGMVSLKYKDDVPHVVMATKGKEKGYLKVTSANSLSLSNFDVSGLGSEKGIKGYFYGERGVWRPGDNIYLVFNLLDKNDVLPKNHPIKLDFENPAGQIVHSQVKTDGVGGLYCFELKTDIDAPTGNWRAVVTVGGETFAQIVKIETIKPNKLKINFKLNDSPYLKTSNIDGTIASAWLHGAPAPNLKTDVEVTFYKTKTYFKGFDAYDFDDFTEDFNTEEHQLFSGKLDENGKVTFSKSLNLQPPGMLQAQFSVRVFEPGGDFSIDQYATTCTPYTSFVGLKTPKPNEYTDMLETNTKHKFQIATVDDKGKAISAKNVRVEIYKAEWNWWWNSSGGGLASYLSSRNQLPVYSTTINTEKGFGSFTYKWTNDDWGRYIIRIKDLSSGHVCSQSVYVDYWSSSRIDLSEAKGATMLKFKTDKEKYKVGEKALVTIPSSKGARALVSIESGSKILNTFWVECEQTQTQFSLPLDANCTPNIYVHVSLIQPHNQTTNDAPMRLYGVIPVFVEDSKTQLSPQINMPDVVRPEQEFVVKVSEKTGQSMSYTLAIVDDGLLDLTRFKTPDPWKKFFEKEALGIRTWDLYDLVIGAYGGKIDGLFAIGGDGDILNKGAAKAQRFKPVVVFMGPFTLKAGGTDQHKIKLPPYIGSVRTMVVASTGKAFGSADKTTQVKKPLMLSTTLPRVMGTDEELFMPVTVFAMEKNVKNVTVTLKENTNFTVVGSKTQSITFNAIGEKVVYFKLKANNNEGVGKISVEATTTDDSASETLEIQVRNPNPYITNSVVQIVEAGKSYQGALNLIGIKGTNTGSVEVSSIPPLNLSYRLHYLLTYPHGCLEQTTSAAFPQLYLKDVANTNATVNARSEQNVKAALSRLLLFQQSEGGFSYWPGERYINSWTTIYAGHFLLEAERMGYALPVGMKKSWLNYETRTAKNWSFAQSDALEQAYRLYVLALAKEPERRAMNQLFEKRATISRQACWLLAGAFALDGKTTIARTIVADIEKSSKETYTAYSSRTFGSSERDDAIILCALNALNDKKQGFLMVKKISDHLNTNKWLSTQSTAWCLMSISKYIEHNNENAQMAFSYVIGDDKKKVSTIKSVVEETLNVAQKTGSLSITFNNEGKNTLYVRFLTRGKAEKGNEIEKAEGVFMRIAYKDMSGAPIDITKLKHGTDFVAEATVTNPGTRGDYTNLVLTQIFPSGWEIKNERLNFDRNDNEEVRYQDIRDDRVYSYFDLKRNETKLIKIKLTATYLGRFYMPAQTCEAMYAPDIMASSLGKWCEVLKD